MARQGRKGGVVFGCLFRGGVQDVFQGSAASRVGSSGKDAFSLRYLVTWS